MLPVSFEIDVTLYLVSDPQIPLTEEQVYLKRKLMEKMNKVLAESPQSGCQNCTLTFPSNKALFGHMWASHQEKKLECQLCHNMYGMKKQLIEHYCRVHFQTKKRKSNHPPKRFEMEPSIKSEVSPYGIKIEN